MEKTWESLHTGSWADVSDDIRKLYSHASLLKVSIGYNRGLSSGQDKRAWIKGAVLRETQI